MRASETSESAKLLTLLEQRAPRPLAIQEIVRLLDLEHYDRKAMRRTLEEEVAKHTLRRIGKTRYQWIRDVDRTGQAAPTNRPRRGATSKTAANRTIEGRYTRVRGGYGFVEVIGRHAEHFTRDILIPAGMEGPALHGDRVTVEITRRDARQHRTVGRIVAVVESAHQHVIGTLERSRHGWRLIPESDRLPAFEIVGDPALDRHAEGLVARLQVTRPATPTRAPGGELIEVLGAGDEPEVQFLSIAYEHGLRIEFPDEVQAETATLPPDPSLADFAGREDLRALSFVTIDGETARDFDDAVCLESQSGGGNRLWVAIADVSHYVRPGSALDLEAAQRGTSVYFPDRAIPMLPPRLSNELCSLNPRRDRLVLVAEMTYDRTAQRTGARFYRAVITSRARLTYTQVAGLLSDADTPDIRAWRSELGTLVPQLRAMHELMTTLYRNRIRAGSLDLDLPEALVDLSEEGRSIGVRLFRRNDAHRLIEEFMLEANRAVATFLRDQQVSFPYRIHEPPDPSDIDTLNEFLAAFGFTVDYADRVQPADVQRVLDALQGHPLARVLSRHLLRSLTQARYSAINEGHFGLAFPIYCHFTSPIRRYPDLLVHRQLTSVIAGDVGAPRAEAESIAAASVESSQHERDAMEAERAMLDLKKTEFMLDHLLEPEAGTIVSVTSFGFFVELDAYPIEGLVRADALTDDRYVLIEGEQSLKGVRKGQRYRLGDRVLVEATNANLRRREIDFALLERLPRTLTLPKAAKKPRRTKAKTHGRKPPDRQRSKRQR